MLRVYALSCGSLEFDRRLFFPAEAPGTPLVAPVSSYLVVHAKGKLVFDTGISCDALADPAGRLGKRVASLFAIRSGAAEDVVSQLAALAIRPDDIRYVVNSHFHFDHCGCNASFPRAQFLVQRAELAIARAERNRYNAKDWDHPLEYREVDGEHDVFGDGSVVCIPTYGHTPGHQSLRVRTDKSEIVLTGDACYFCRTLKERRLPARAFDKAQMLASLDRLEALEKGGAKLIFGHDPEFWKSVPQGPQPLF